MSRIWRNETLNADPDRVQCAVCHFPGVPLDFVQAQDTDVTLMPSTSAGGLRVALVALPGHCPFCGTNRVFDGQKGDL